MTHFDVFNGDADGLCALHQLRLETPLESVLVTGVKRDIALLQRVPAQRGDAVTALDISAATNHDALVALLERGVAVQYFDHHYAGDLPRHPGLAATIDPSPGVCTAMLVDRYLGGKRRIWAIVAAFGDNLPDAARELAQTLALSDKRVAELRELGENLAYNSYGEKISDLVIPPAALYEVMHHYVDPFQFIREEPVIARLSKARRDDLAMASEVDPKLAFENATIYVLPEAAWSRRVSGVFSNHLANCFPHLAHAVLTPNTQGGYTVSVRAPAALRTGADTLCRQFMTGGGRAEAAGINHLPREALPEFARRFEQAFSRAPNRVIP
jgi:single-stranded DNA-specific DHH superfamily exonuclease